MRMFLQDAKSFAEDRADAGLWLDGHQVHTCVGLLEHGHSCTDPQDAGARPGIENPDHATARADRLGHPLGDREGG